MLGGVTPTQQDTGTRQDTGTQQDTDTQRESGSERDPGAELAALARAAHRLVRGARLLGRPLGRRPAPAALPERGARPAADPSGARPAPSPSVAAPSAASPGPAAPPTAPDAPRRPAPASAPSAAPSPPPGRPQSLPADFTSPALEVAKAATTLDELETSVAQCRACGLCATRTRTVFGDGAKGAKVLFVGEGPGAEEDRTGTPFVGPAGQLLTDIITKGMGLDRAKDAYIANVVKCRPPGNRDPQPLEKATCAPFLERQIELVDPQVIVPLGRHAANHLLGTQTTMGRLRGRVVRRDGRAIVPTFHPAYLLRTPARKRDCWADIQLAMAELGLEPPASRAAGGGDPSGGGSGAGTDG